MVGFDQGIVDLFKEKAKLAATEVVERPDMSGALEYALEVCAAKEPFQPLLPKKSGAMKTDGKIMAASGLPQADYQALAEAGQKQGVVVVKDGLRERLAGIDVTLSLADLGVASTGTCVLGCPGEDDRLATMVCETHVVVLPKTRLVRDSYQAEDLLRGLLAGDAMYISFISGCSRTSDIERVLTFGVHGPLSMHVVLLDC